MCMFIYFVCRERDRDSKPVQISSVFHLPLTIVVSVWLESKKQPVDSVVFPFKMKVDCYILIHNNNIMHLNLTLTGDMSSGSAWDRVIVLGHAVPQ